MRRYLIIIEKTETGFSSYSPDLDGCVAAGKTKTEVTKKMKEAVEFHFEGLREEGFAIPQPKSHSGYLNVTHERKKGYSVRVA